jgi:hypothetical protein
MSWILKEKWFWLIILLAALIFTVPFIVVYLVLFLPPIWGPMVATVTIVVLWGVVSGYKDWLTAKRKEEEEKKSREFS